MAAVVCNKVLVVRNDRLGDFMLAWPALALLRTSLPGTRISVLVPAYTVPVAQACPWIDDVLVDPGATAPLADQRAMLTQLRESNFGALLTLFSTWRVAWLGLRSGIPLRVAPATKLAQVFYPVRVVQRRSRSEKPEYLYNLELARVLLHHLGAQEREVTAPYWPLSEAQRVSERRELVRKLGLAPHRSWFFVHAGSGGSANNLSLDQYADLIVRLDSSLGAKPVEGKPVAWILTAGPGEAPQTHDLAARLRAHGLDPVVYESQAGLLPFARSLTAADLFIAGSTGPLHVAGCLDVPTVGFFPAKRSSTALRWQPCNGTNRTLGLQMPGQEPETAMNRIDLEGAAQQVAGFWRRLRGELL